MTHHSPAIQSLNTPTQRHAHAHTHAHTIHHQDEHAIHKGTPRDI